jgi:putative Ca2+/H+ antiporter (TMEM165/GDT1 family)
MQVGETFGPAMSVVAGSKEPPFGPARRVAVQLPVIAAVFPVIFIGELPDKTMFASLVLSTRGRPLLVWLGAAGAFVIHVVIAVTAGVALFHLLPRQAVDGAVAVLFLGGAALALYQAARARQENVLIARQVAVRRRVLTTSLIVIFLAEWGDLTQILTANLAAHYHAPLSVGVGSVLALWAVAGIAVAGGQGILRLVDIRTVRIATTIVLVALAGWAGWQAIS